MSSHLSGHRSRWAWRAMSGLRRAGRANGVVLVEVEPGGPLHAYQLDRTPREWDDARLFAASQTYRGVPGHLMTITHSIEQFWAQQIAPHQDTWIGLTDQEVRGGSEGGDQTGLPRPHAGTGLPPAPGQRGHGWVWVTGEPVTYENWGTFEPNDSGGEDAVNLRPDGLWNDDRAGAVYGQGGRNMVSIIEYDVSANPATVDAFKVTLAKHYNGVTNLAIADDVAAGVYPSVMTTGQLPLLDLRDSGGDANAPFGQPLPGLTQDVDDNHFVSVNTATLDVASDGMYTFAFNSDDGGRLTIDGIVVAEYFASRGSSNSIAFPVELTAGHHTLEFIWFENGGGAQAEVGYAAGIKAQLDGDFTLVGDPSKGIGLVGSIESTTYKVTLPSNLSITDNLPLDGFQIANNLLDGTTPATKFQYFADVINFSENGTASFFGNDDPYLGLKETQNRERYVLEATALLEIVEAGTYTFGTRSDNGAVLTIGGTDVISDISMSGRNAFGSIFLTPGLHPLRLVHWTDSPQAELELFAALGDFTSFDAQLFRLVGDVANGGLRVTQNTQPRSAPGVPEPSHLVLLGAWALLSHRRRRAASRA